MKRLLLFITAYCIFTVAGYSQFVNPVFTFENGINDTIAWNMMTSGAADNSTASRVENPYKSGLNTSNYVGKIHRSSSALMWCGFWAPNPVDVTTQKFVHLLLLKSVKDSSGDNGLVLSKPHFKIETGDEDDDLEIGSSNTYKQVNEWQEMIFDFSNRTGKYAKIVFIPDWGDTTNRELDIYFDNVTFTASADPIFLPTNVKKVDSNISKVYYNSITDELKIKSSNGLEKVVVNNILGSQVLLSRLSGQAASISTSGLAKGTYLVTLYNESGQVYTSKFIK